MIPASLRAAYSASGVGIRQNSNLSRDRSYPLAIPEMILRGLDHGINDPAIMRG